MERTLEGIYQELGLYEAGHRPGDDVQYFFDNVGPDKATGGLIVSCDPHSDKIYRPEAHLEIAMTRAADRVIHGNGQLNAANDGYFNARDQQPETITVTAALNMASGIQVVEAIQFKTHNGGLTYRVEGLVRMDRAYLEPTDRVAGNTMDKLLHAVWAARRSQTPALLSGEDPKGITPLNVKSAKAGKAAPRR